MKSHLRHGSILLLALGACAVNSTDDAKTTSEAFTVVTNPITVPGGALTIDSDVGLLHPLGVIPEDPSVRAARPLVHPLALTADGVLPSTVDLSAKIGPPGDQGQEGSCVGWAVAYAAKTLAETTELGWSPSTPNHEFSPSWLYNQINGGEDKGTHVSTAMDFVVSHGLDDLSSFPYVAGDYTSQPSSDSMRRAARFKAQSWVSIPNTIGDIKTVLAGGNAVVIAMNVYPDFDGLDASTNDTYDMDIGNRRGRHAIAIIGYDDARKAFRIINSWGPWWGSQGYGWIAYSLMDSGKVDIEPFVLNDARDTFDPPPTITAITPSYGPREGGTFVRIDGTNFDKTLTEVTFGGKPAASLSCVSTSTCVAATPPGVGSVMMALSVVKSSTTMPFAYNPIAPSCTVSVAPCGSVTFACPPTVDYLTYEYQLPDGTWGPSTTFNTSHVDSFKSVEPYTVRFCTSNRAGTACDAPQTFTPDITGLLTSCQGVNGTKACGKTPDHCGGILDCGACPVITTCEGESRPTTKCSAGWHCCGGDGWNCGVCP